jgi:hypothetical protein
MHASQKLLVAASVACSLLFTARISAAATITENWDSLPITAAPSAPGTFYSLGDGWTARESDITQNNYFGVTNSGQGQNALSGSNWLGQVDGSNRDGNTASMLALSPFFRVDGSGNPIVMNVEGGNNGSTAPTNISAIGTTLVASGGGWQGVALLDQAGNVLETAQRSTDNNSYQALQLSTVGLNPSASYQVALIDTFSGGWGWVAMDDVSIPGTLVPEPSSIVALVGLCGMGLIGLIRYRRRAVSKVA